ncbi:MAG: helix-turn-helix domain-containing protein [Prevotellaceae bacterium]|jgi:transcriptional regulator with XRE-family HTH domain|nr:helix-turn-helix domain-containing protein [Prevotellaceae bacterium]
MDSVKKRLIEFLKRKKITQSKFTKMIDVSSTYVNSMSENPTADTINKIKSNFPELNLDWLLTGDGEMLKNVITQNNVEGDNIQGNTVTVNKSQTDKLLDLIKIKDEQLSKCQAQIDRLIGLLEKNK